MIMSNGKEVRRPQMRIAACIIMAAWLSHTWWLLLRPKVSVMRSPR
jgi:hypothetical protein